MNELPAKNNRILLIDDAPSIHADFRKILAGAGEQAAWLDSGWLDPASSPARQFELDSAFQGEEGAEFVAAALEEGRPYAMAFVDMRMPPGWDGLQTIARLWELDPRLQVVICTAFSDHSWEDVLEQLDAQDRLLVLKKPFDMIEVVQAAHTLTTKWSLAFRAEQQLRELERTVQQLRASERELRHARGELEAFSHAVAHDLRSPLAILRSFGELLAGEIPAGSRAAHFLGRMQANAEVAQELLSGLFALTQIARAELRLQPVDLGRMVRTLVAELQHAAPERRARIEVQEGLSAWADPSLMQTAIRNLVENAWKFTSRRELAEIQVGIAQDAAEPTYFVRDNGCGFDMAYADNLFRDFRRLHDQAEYPGTGMGLVTVSRVVARHGGRIWAESAPGQGSTFYFTLPRPGAPAHGGEAVPSPAGT